MVALPLRSPAIAPVRASTETVLDLEEVKRRPPSFPLSCVTSTGKAIFSLTQSVTLSEERVTAVGAGTMVTV